MLHVSINVREQKYTINLFDNKLLLCEGKMEDFGSIKDNQQE